MVAEMTAEIVADLGGEAQVSALARSLVRSFARLQLHEEALADNVERHGALSGKGRTRAAASLLLQVIDRKARIAQQLGLQRRARRLNAFQAAAAAPEVPHGR